MPIFSVALGWNAIEAGLMSAATAGALVAAGIVVIRVGSLASVAGSLNKLDGQLRRAAVTDAMTKVLNAAGFKLLAGHLMISSARKGTPLTMLFFDLDRLKMVNDTHGHEAGSELICSFASLLTDTFRESDVVARVGGDEFVVLCEMESAGIALSRLERAQAAHNAAAKGPKRIEFSVGQASWDPASKVTLAELTALADANMYEDKRAKRESKTAQTERDSVAPGAVRVAQ